MPLAAGDWICRSCWKSNRPHDDLCYRCRAPRAGRTTSTGDRATASIRGDQLIPRVLVTLPAAFLRLYAVGSLLSILLLILLLIFSILTIAVPRSSGVLNVVAALGLIVVQLAFIRGLLAAARAITNHRRWGYLVGLAMTAPSAVASVTLVVGYPEFMARPWAPVVAWSLIAYYGILALLSLAALASSFVRRDVPVARD